MTFVFLVNCEFVEEAQGHQSYHGKNGAQVHYNEEFLERKYKDFEKFIILTSAKWVYYE